MPLTQQNLQVQLTTPLGKDKLIVQRFSGGELVSGLFEFELEMISDSDNLSFDSIIGKNVTVSITMQDTKKRLFNGLVKRFIECSRLPRRV